MVAIIGKFECTYKLFLKLLVVAKSFINTSDSAIRVAGRFKPTNYSSRPQELFNWLLALDDRDYDSWDKGKISWHVRYQRTASRTHRHFEASKGGAAKSLQADEPTLGGDVDKHIDDDETVSWFCFLDVHNSTCYGIGSCDWFLQPCFNLLFSILLFESPGFKSVQRGSNFTSHRDPLQRSQPGAL